MSNHEHCCVIGSKDIQSFLSEENDLQDRAIIESLVSDITPAFLVRFPYGAEIIQQGRLQVPCNNGAKCQPCSEMAKAIEATAPTPLSLVLHGAVEAFLPLQASDGKWAPSRPMRILSRGEFFGVFETLDATFNHSATPAPWGVTSGARSVLLLATKISARGERWLEEILRGRHAKDRRELPELLARIRQDSWEFVRHLVSGGQRTNYWTTEVLVLPWAFHPSQTHPPEALLRIAEIGWAQSRHFRDHLVGEESLVLNKHLINRKIHRDERIAVFGALRQIIAMARGEVPAFSVATTDSLLPFEILHQELKGAPDLKSAIIMEPKHLQKTGDAAFVSIKFNVLPALRSKEPRTFVSFCHHVEESLQHLNEHSIDLTQTRFLKKDEALEIFATNCAASDPSIISSRHPFLTACLKIVRNR